MNWGDLGGDKDLVVGGDGEGEKGKLWPESSLKRKPEELVAELVAREGSGSSWSVIIGKLSDRDGSVMNSEDSFRTGDDEALRLYAGDGDSGSERAEWSGGDMAPLGEVAMC